jgi:hypothetical protein
MFQIFKRRGLFLTNLNFNGVNVFHKLQTRLFTVLGLLIIAAALSINASAVTVDFTTDTIGAKPNGFQSSQSSLVSFSDSIGADLRVGNFFNQSIGNGLFVGSDDASELIMNFSVNVTSLSLVFGNDDPGFSAFGDRARLTLFLNGVQVGQVFVTLNRDDSANQTITSPTGLVFNSARFVFVNSVGTGTPINLTEIVDNINFALLPTAATVSVSGHVTSLLGRGITGVQLSLTDSEGNIRTATTTTFGYYQFTDVQVGETYILSAKGKHYTFSQPVQVLNINGETNEVNFTANSEKRLRDF